MGVPAWIQFDPPVCMDPYCDDNVILSDDSPLTVGMQVRFENGREFVVGDLTTWGLSDGCSCCTEEVGRGSWDSVTDVHTHGPLIVAYRNLLPEEDQP